jgi:hypothetical protein
LKSLMLTAVPPCGAGLSGTVADADGGGVCMPGIPGVMPDMPGVMPD